MARSVQYWYDFIIAEKNTLSTLNTLQPNIDSAQTLLNDVTTTSRVARWRLWAWAAAACAYVLDVLFDLLTLEMQAIAANAQYGTLPWWVYFSKKFQYGDTLVWQNNQYQYATINPSAQIIAMAASQESGNTVLLKVAKLVGTTITKLNSSELAAFTAYIYNQKTRPGGVVVSIISDDADALILNADIYFDPLVLLDTGESIANPGTFPVEDAINNFIANFSQTDFNGIFELSDLTQVIKAVNGVKEPYVTGASSKYGTNPFIPFTERYQAHAGYLAIDSGSPLNTTLTYIPYV